MAPPSWGFMSQYGSLEFTGYILHKDPLKPLFVLPSIQQMGSDFKEVTPKVIGGLRSEQPSLFKAPKSITDRISLEKLWDEYRELSLILMIIFCIHYMPTIMLTALQLLHGFTFFILIATRHIWLLSSGSVVGLSWEMPCVKYTWDFKDSERM